MFNPLHRLCPPARCNLRLICNGFHSSARTAIRSRLCGPNTFSPLPNLHIFLENARFLPRPSPSFKRPSLASPNFPKSAIRSRLCGPNPLPSPFRVFFEPFSLKSIGLLRLGPALLRLSHTWPFSARNAIRSRLCSTNKLSSLPILHFFRGNAVFYCARALFVSAQALRPRISLKTQSAHACAVQTRFRPSHFGVFV